MLLLLACTAPTDDTANAADDSGTPSGDDTAPSEWGVGTLDRTSDLDTWEIDVAEPSFLRVRVQQPEMAPVQVYVADEQGARIASRPITTGDLVAWIPTAGTWTLEVEIRDGVSAPVDGAAYTLTPSFEAPFAEPDDPTTATDASGDQGILLETDDDVDYVLVQPGSWGIGVSGALTDGFTGTMTATLLDGTLYGSGTFLDLFAIEPVIVAVQKMNGEGGDWNVLHTMEYPNSTELEVEPNDTTPQGLSGSVAVSVYGTISASGDIDSYRVSIDPSEEVEAFVYGCSPLEGAEVEVTGENGDYTVTVTAEGGYGPGGWYVLSVSAIDTGSGTDCDVVREDGSCPITEGSSP